MAKKQQKSEIQWEGVITNIQSVVLAKLARYKFLTLSQLLSLEVGTTQYKYLWKQITSLRDRRQPLVKCQQFNTVTAVSSSGKKTPERVEDLYYLSKEGTKALRQELGFEELIKIPVGRRLAYKDYRHRKRVIDFQIQLDLWTNENESVIPFFDTYFDKEGNNKVSGNLRAKTRIDFGSSGFFIPDAAFKMEQMDNQKFFLFEMYNGTDVKRTTVQLHRHGIAMANRYTHKAYALPKNKSYNIILLFERDGLKNSVIDRVKKNEPAFNKMEKYFRLKSLADLAEGDFFENWLTLHGTHTNLI